MIKRALQISCLMASLAMANETRQVEISAAQESARAELRGQIFASPVAPGMTLRHAVGRDPDFSVESILDAAEQVGAPRWIEQDIVQVRMQVQASKVVERLEALPADKRDPRLTAADLQRLNRDWKNRTFQATGQAIPVSRISSLIANVQTPAWQGVPQPAREDAARRANASAVATIVSSTSNIRVGSGETIDQSFKPDAQAKLTTWASGLPATSVVMRDDRQVEIGVFVDRQGLAAELKGVVSEKIGSSSQKIEMLNRGVDSLPTIVVGRAGLSAHASEQNAARLVIRETPKWAGNPLVAQGESARGASRLLTARQAEKQAKQELTRAIEKLVVGEQTLQQAAANDPAVANAIQRAVERSRVYQVDYNADGSATTRVTLDPNELIDEINASR